MKRAIGFILRVGNRAFHLLDEGETFLMSPVALSFRTAALKHRPAILAIDELK
jgi:hypothetical protein